MIIRFRRNSKGMFRFVSSILFILAIPIILSSVLSCRVSVQGEPYGPGPRPAHLSRLEGPWSINFNNYPGRLEFSWTRGAWAGRFWDTGHNQWEELRDIFFDPQTGQLEFKHGYQQWLGTLSGNRILGTFSVPGLGQYHWEGWR
jgi:hypothetical protein